MKLKLSRDEEDQLMKAVKTVDELKSRTRLLMAGIKVTDLKKEQERKEEERERNVYLVVFWDGNIEMHIDA